MGLKGKTILTTRAASQSGELRAKLESLGARVIECPSIEIVPVDDWSAVDDSVRRIDTYQWLLFTSANAVELFMKRVEFLNAACTLSIAVVGASTARRLRNWKLEPTIIPSEFRAEGLLDAMPRDLSGLSILFPRAETAREVLPEELRRRGARVDVVTVYRTVKPDVEARLIAEVLASERVDCIVFTSPSAVRRVAAEIPIAVIGPVTRDAAVAGGLTVTIMPTRATVDDLVDAIVLGIGSSRPV